MQGSFVKRKVEAAQVRWSDSLRTVRFQRLEADLGTTLLTRAVIGKARQPTWAGARLLHHLECDGIGAMTTDVLRGKAGFDLPPADLLAADHRAFSPPRDDPGHHAHQRPSTTSPCPAS